jgi:hypothetical protein
MNSFAIRANCWASTSAWFLQVVAPREGEEGGSLRKAAETAQAG